MAARGSFFLIVTQAGGSLIYDRLEEAVDWAEEQDRNGGEVFLGMNPREREARRKEAVDRVTCCFADLDLPDGETPGAALERLTSGDGPPPSFVTNSGYGLHAVYLLSEPSPDKALWSGVQRGFVRALSDLGADKQVATDETRVLRLIPFRNRKRWPAGVETALLYESDARYELGELAAAVVLRGGTSFSRSEVLVFPGQRHQDEGTGDEGPVDWPDDDEMDRLVARSESTRITFELWIRRNMKPGLHYGIVPIDGQEASKPTLVKPGAELVVRPDRCDDSVRGCHSLPNSATMWP